MEAHQPSADLEFLLKHGIFIERQAEMATDGLRALMLEYSGYTTKIFEFVSGEHTAKNIMIVAEKSRKKSHDGETLQKIKDAKDFYGIGQHHLERLLKI
jgi:hypothetical protein